MKSWHNGVSGVTNHRNMALGSERFLSARCQGATDPVYLFSACDRNWSHFDDLSHAPPKDISYSIHNAVVDILELVGRCDDDNTLPLSW